MTIAVAISTVDSLVLASDSTTSMQVPKPGGHVDTVNLWNSANKIFNLHKCWPVSAMTWGRASIGGFSIATLAKELRCRLSGTRPGFEGWKLDPATYTIEQVAQRAREFFYEEHYAKEPGGLLGLAIAGYSADSDKAEVYNLQFDDDGCAEPKLTQPPGEAFIAWHGQPEAITRLVYGFSSSLPAALVQLGVPEQNVIPYTEAIGKLTQVPLVWPGMPIGEVIDLAEFLVDATIRFTRFTPGHQTVGGPIEIAAVTRHEGFKWVKRKHHYPPHLNTDGTLP
jgi:hypothetical protein